LAPAQPETRRIVPILLAVIPFSQIPLDAYTPALPMMVHELSTTPATIQNTVTAYMLGMSLALIPVGMLSDAHGRKPILIGGMALLIVMSIACAFARSVDGLLTERFLQGVGGCTCLVVTYAIAADCFRGPKLTAISGLLGSAWGLAPVLAPAAGGLLVEYISWRGIFGAIAVAAAIVVLTAVIWLPETLVRDRRTPVRLGTTVATILRAMRNAKFLAFTLVFGAMASAQMVFGVVAPFLYQTLLGFTPAAYGLVALLLGGVNLIGELSCSGLAPRMGARRLAFGGLSPYLAGAVILAGTGLAVGPGLFGITIGGALVLGGCGLLCPMMYGMALGLFERDLGLLGGLVSAICYLLVSGAMAVAAVLPESSQTPLGFLYLLLGLVAGGLLAWVMAPGRGVPGPA
jgi:DHA1 family bicyclomycin/chloramphenicol resistance-like MFS transporter